MAIKIIDEPDIHLTPSEVNRLSKEWEKVCSMNVRPPTFEEFVRSIATELKNRNAK
jgi:hypothetical protein